MALPAKRVPESVAHLDLEIVAAALIRHDANVRNTARALGVPSGDLRKLVLVDQRLADAALEAVELRLDDAEANLCEALRCDDPRRRDSVSMFMLRNVQRASKRGYAVAASAASLEIGSARRAPQTDVIRWGDDGRDREMDVIERDGKEISIPRYDKVRRDGCLEGEVATPAVLIEHAAPVASEPQPVASSPLEALSVVPEPESATVRYQRERIDAWIRIASSPIRSPLFVCRKPIIAGQDWQEVSNGDTNARARFHRTCHAEWRTEREAAARQALGLRAEPFRWAKVG